MNDTNTESAMVKLKSSGRYITGDVVILTGNFAVVQKKEVKDGKLIIIQEPFDLADIQTITIVREAEVKGTPQLLTEADNQPTCC